MGKFNQIVAAVSTYLALSGPAMAQDQQKITAQQVVVALADATPPVRTQADTIVATAKVGEAKLKEEVSTADSAIAPAAKPQERGQKTEDGRDFAGLDEKAVDGLTRKDKKAYYVWKNTELDQAVLSKVAVKEEIDKTVLSKVAVKEEIDKTVLSKVAVKEEIDKTVLSKVAVKEEIDKTVLSLDQGITKGQETVLSKATLLAEIKGVEIANEQILNRQGIVLQMASLTENTPKESLEQLKQSIQGDEKLLADPLLSDFCERIIAGKCPPPLQQDLQNVKKWTLDPANTVKTV